MYHKWLDGWDERRAQRGDAVKSETEFALGAEYAFPETNGITNIEEFCFRANQAVADQTFFDEPTGSPLDVQRTGEWIKFASDISTETNENNVVWAKISDSGSLDQALVVFHHWNASSRNRQIANFFSRRGITVIEIALPYHFERSRIGSSHADYIISPNIGRTVQSVRQGVMDGRKLIRWLQQEGYGQISVLGMSLGSWVAGLIAAHDRAVSKASLFLTAGSLAEMVWTGRATRLIRQSLQSSIEMDDLKRAWGPLDLENYAERLARPDLDLQIVLAKRDKVVLPELSERFMGVLDAAGAKPSIVRLNCGHYSLALPPHILFAGMGLKRLLMK